MAVTSVQDRFEILDRADRYDIGTNTWCRIADLKVHRQDAYGAAAYGKIFIAGGANEYSPLTIEVYHETTDEWQLIASMQATIRDYRPWLCGMVCAEGKLFVLNNLQSSISSPDYRQIECYDLDNDEWKETSRIEKNSFLLGAKDSLCSAMVFQGSKFFEQATILDVSPSIISAEGQSKSYGKRRCVVM